MRNLPETFEPMAVAAGRGQTHLFGKDMVVHLRDGLPQLMPPLLQMVLSLY